MAAGKGTRIKSTNYNKVTIPFMNKPLVIYSVELMKKVSDEQIVVVGAFHESVRKVLKGYDINFAYQKNQLGTGHAVATGLKEIERQGWNPEQVLVGYGDHTMFYKKESVEKLIAVHRTNRAAISLLTCVYDDPDKIRYGRIIRNSENMVIDIVEQKEASNAIRAIKEINPGFYCFDYAFLRDNIGKLKRTPVSHEYYITDIIKIAAVQKQKVIPLPIDFKEAGLGVNTIEELKESEKLFIRN